MATKTMYLEDDKTHLIEGTKKVLGTDGRHQLPEVDGLAVYVVVQNGRVLRYEATDSSGRPAELSFMKMRTAGADVAGQDGGTCWVCHTFRGGRQVCWPVECPPD